jgi:hypothetical protein
VGGDLRADGSGSVNRDQLALCSSILLLDPRSCSSILLLLLLLILILILILDPRS